MHINIFVDRRQAEGAIPNGTRVVKVESEPGDTHPVGSKGKVVGSIKTPPEVLQEFPRVPYAYFVEWDAHPGVPVFLVGWKIAPEVKQ